MKRLMRTLGIESTAHTFGAGVSDGGDILSNVRDMYVPAKGGIHPREAADHHVDAADRVVTGALEEAGISEDEVQLVCFSQGPGLGPCLRVGATVARVLSLKHHIPIIGVNHCVAHLEIGKLLGCRDPILMYTSGANTQIISFARGRYRVLGETLDIGVGNMLDKLGREVGIGFPSGPEIERLARGEAVKGVEGVIEGTAPELLELPYTVKGMDVSFSGLMTAALNLWKRGENPPSVCMSVQETAFSMMCEVSERAMAHVGTGELLLGGGVACNGRLQGMARIMAEERGGESFVPPKDLAVDNGAMIAFLGEIMHESGVRHDLEDTVIDQRFRTDQVEVLWKGNKMLGRIDTPGTISLGIGERPPVGAVLGRGAEATITFEPFLGMDSVRKVRKRKGYRHQELERWLSSRRMRKEARMLMFARGLGVRTPRVLDIDLNKGVLVLEFLAGPRLANILNVLPEEKQRGAISKVGEIVGRMHEGEMVHGDITTSNFIVLSMNEMGPDLAVIDTSLAERSSEVERRGVDLRLFFEVFHSTHQDLAYMEEEFWRGYSGAYTDWKRAREKMNEINSRGRYSSRRW